MQSVPTRQKQKHPAGKHGLALLLLLLLLLAIILTSGCAGGYSLQARTELAAAVAEGAGFERVAFRDAGLPVAGWIRRDAEHSAEVLAVYIEGDGLAWVNPQRQSTNPTPLDPLALRFAVHDPRPGVAYLGRPCQYLACSDVRAMRRYWGGARFAPRVVHTYQRILDELKRETRAGRLELVGYSGGGALALLLAAGRDDVARVITVAGLLDTDDFVARHGLAPMNESLNPADFADALAGIPQLHIAGSDDRVIPPAVAARFLERLHGQAEAGLLLLPNDHHSWPADTVWRAMQGNSR